MAWEDEVRNEIVSQVRAYSCSSYHELKEFVKNLLRARDIPFNEERDPTKGMLSFCTPSFGGKRLVVTLKDDNTAGLCDEDMLETNAKCTIPGQDPEPFKDIVKRY